MCVRATASRTVCVCVCEMKEILDLGGGDEEQESSG